MTTNHLPARITRLFVDAGLVALLVVLVVVVLGCSHYLGSDGPSQHRDAEYTAAAVADGEQASADLQTEYLFVLQREQAAQPDVWTPETKERARMAVRLVAQGVTE